MSHRGAVASFTTAALSALALLGATTAGAASAATVAVQARSQLATPSRLVASTAASADVQFSLGLKLRNRASAVAFAEAVSNPMSSQYRHFLSTAKWERLYSPAQSSVEAATAWLTSEGITVKSVASDRMAINAVGSAAAVEHAFGVSLGEYQREGRQVRLASGSLTVPSYLGSVVSGVTGVNQSVAKPDSITGGGEVGESQAQEEGEAAAGVKPTAVRSGSPATETEKEKEEKEENEGILQPPAGFRNAPPCSTYFGEKKASVPSAGSGYGTIPWAVCGYVPAQLQGGYELGEAIATGDDGAGVTVAIIDAYANPTLAEDTQKYSEINEKNFPALTSPQLTEKLSPTYNEGLLCQADGWSAEQTLDVESVHAMAPGANILFVGAENCVTGLYNAVNEVVGEHEKNHVSVITDSWADTGGDLFDPASEREMFDEVLMTAAGTGIGVQFSAGDEGSNFTNLGMNIPDYPSESPWATSAGGTTLEVSKQNTRTAEYGWSTSKAFLCTKLLEEYEFPGCTRDFRGWAPPAPGAYDYGGGGGTSYEYPQPPYQEGVVPADLADRNAKVTGIANRVEPDISMDADPSTGMKIGETQTFYYEGAIKKYEEYRLGGTSLASPLLAGLVADADQAVKGSLGFLNPLIYQIRAQSSSVLFPGALNDIVSSGKQAMARNDYLDEENSEYGIYTTLRGIGFEGLESYCSGTEECETQNVELKAFPGFDSMTGVGAPGPEFIATAVRIAH